METRVAVQRPEHVHIDVGISQGGTGRLLITAKHGDDRPVKAPR